MTAKRCKTVPPSAGGKRPSKSPAIAPSYESPLQLRPAWRIELLEKNGPYGWETIKGVLLWNTILPKLQNFETMTWGEILGSQNHEVQVSSLCSEAQKRLKMLKLDDIEHLVSLRLSGKMRIWGLKKHRVLRILWWDPKHQVCPSIKKHT